MLKDLNWHGHPVCDDVAAELVARDIPNGGELHQENVIYYGALQTTTAHYVVLCSKIQPTDVLESLKPLSESEYLLPYYLPIPRKTRSFTVAQMQGTINIHPSSTRNTQGAEALETIPTASPAILLRQVDITGGTFQHLSILEHIARYNAHSAALQGGLPPTFCLDLTKAIQQLHDAEFVLGNQLRNMMVTEEDNLYLIDPGWTV
ncbi:hypothetical protein M405DRAFT_882261 [Rhizopogon salebrosus TDB-379]|nr:hypothetical protein M405DRAFT_882261 [Rhizopogon salebrosus TDB-379]